MTENGMKDVSNPSELFLTDNVLKEPQEGSAVMATSEGSRTLLAEVQCLVTANHYSTNSMRPSSPKRTSGGFPIQRLLLLCAVIEKRLRLPLWNRDIFLNIVGGLTISDPSADLAVLVSIVSSLLSKPIKVGTAFIGEVGLGGELRNTKKIEQKIMEAIKLGFRRVIVPKISIKQQVFDQLLDKASAIKPEIIPCANVFEAIENGLLLNGKTLLEARHAFRGNKKPKPRNDDFSSIEPDFNEHDQLDIDQNID
jgi:DNA repair protein RadA/Sms